MKSDIQMSQPLIEARGLLLRVPIFNPDDRWILTNPTRLLMDFYFTRTQRNIVTILDGISFTLQPGEAIRVVGYLKPIPTLKKALRSVDMISKKPFLAQHERSDTCVVPAAGVIGEAMVALVLAEAVIEKVGGDSIGEARRNYDSYCEQLRRFAQAPAPATQH